MKVVSSGKTDKLSFTLKLSDERLKLFIDVALLPPQVEPEPQLVVSESGAISEAGVLFKPQAQPDKSAQAASANQNQQVAAGSESKPETDNKTKEPNPGAASNKITKPGPVSIPVEFPTITKEEILAILPKEVWDGCIHHDVIDNIAKELSKGLKVEDRRIAKGIEAKDGTDGKFILTVKKMSPKPEIHEDEKGFIEFKDLHRFENIRSGTVVAKVIAARPGTPGTDPLGKSLPAKNGQPCKLVFDQTLELKNHAEGTGQDLVALVDGFLSDDGGRLSIQQELKVSGCIDYKVGSIDFIGSVLINGDVLPGFLVKARKGVVIKGAVQEATVISSEGSVTIVGHCMGSPTSKIEAKTEISLTVANEVEAQAGTIISIAKEARDCQLRSGGNITGMKASLIGGSFYCACGIEAKAIGAKSGSATTISLSSDIGMTVEFAENEQRIADHEKILALLKAHLGPFASSESALSALSAAHKEKLQPILTKKRSVEASLTELNLKKEQLLANAHANHIFRVSFSDVLYSGVTVIAGEDRFVLKEDIKGPKSLTYSPENKRFEMTEIKALECALIENTQKEEKDDGKKSAR